MRVELYGCQKGNQKDVVVVMEEEEDPMEINSVWKHMSDEQIQMTVNGSPKAKLKYDNIQNKMEQTRYKVL